MNTFPESPRSLVVTDLQNPNESPIFQHSTTLKENGGKLISTFRCIPEADTTCKLLKGAIVKYGDCKCVGEREIIFDQNFSPKLGSYVFATYKEFNEKVRMFAAGLASLGLRPGDKIGIYSVNCAWWQTTAYACNISSLIPVPIYDSLGPGAAEYIINHSECSAVVVSKEKFESLNHVMI